MKGKIDIKSPEQITIMQRGGEILSSVVWDVMDALSPGMTELEVDLLAEKLIRERGGEPGFKRVDGYKHTICISTNDVVVHGIPGGYVFKEGDVVGVDCGVFYRGFHTDMSETRRISNLTFQKANLKTNKDEIDKFLAVGKKTLDAAIQVATVGNHIGDISKTIQDIVEKKGGYSVVRSLIGHGVGRELHEPPEVPGYLIGKIDQTPLLREGMTIAIEVIYNKGQAGVVLDRDGWTIRTEDRSLSGLYERTIAITKEGPKILTK